MKKRIKDITFEEFADWANKRACDGRWNMETAILCSSIITEVYNQTRKIFFKRKKKQEKLFEHYKSLYLSIDTEI